MREHPLPPWKAALVEWIVQTGVIEKAYVVVNMPPTFGSPVAADPRGTPQGASERSEVKP